MSMSRRLAVSAVLLMAGLLACGTPPAPEPLHTGSVNLILGDASFQARFGRLPTVHDDEDLRIRVHLEYVLGLLRQRSTEGLSASARAARTRQLQRLESYLRRGEFPRNDGHPDARRPTFIDSRGRICAVGFLLEQELGRQAAEAIASAYKYAFIREIDSPLLARWAATTGLAREELEMIQPSYPDDTREETLGPFFSLLEQVDGRGHAALSSGLLFDGRDDGVPVQLDLSLAIMRDFAHKSHFVGLYTDVSVTKLTGASRAASALSNLDVGLAWASSFLDEALWLTLRGGLLLPTGDEDEVGMALNDAMAARRPARAVLFQPGALGGRLGASMTLPGALCEGCSFRLDAGLDGYSPFARSFQLSPRWGAGFAYLFRPFAATLEVAGARYAKDSASERELHHSVGGSLRYIPEVAGYYVSSLQPGVSVSMPLEGGIQRAFVGFDLTLRH